VLVAIAVLALFSPVSSSLFQQASSNANLTGFEKIVIEHFNIVILAVLTLILFIGGAALFGGGRD